MIRNPQTRPFLTATLRDTPRPSEPAASTPNDGLAALLLVADPSVDEQTRGCAAVNFTNHLKTRWVASSPADSIPDDEKEKIKNIIVPVMLSSAADRKIQLQLREALDVIGKHDFPEFWPALLPDLELSLEGAINNNDFASVNGILATVNSLFKRFRRESNCLYKKPRYQFKSKPVQVDLTYCSDHFAAPLWTTVVSISRKLKAGVGSVATLRQLLEAGRLCCRIFYSLSYQKLPEEFEDKADEWMNEFKMYLNPAITIEDADEDCLSLVDELRAAVCEIIILYMEKWEQLLEKHLSFFVQAVCGLLVGGVTSERLTVAGIKFLSIVSRSSVHHELFAAGDELLPQIIQSIVIPNVMVRDEDEKLFRTYYVQLMRRDMEGDDGHPDTRRTVACDLLKGIAGNYKEKITKSVTTQIHKCLALFADNPVANWKYKVSAIDLVVSLASVSTDLVDVEGFFSSVILPELLDSNTSAFPMLKAAALNFFTMFPVFIPKHVAMPLLCGLISYIRLEAGLVVCSYAAICIEKLLAVKDDTNRLQPRYTSMDINPIHEELLFKLFRALELIGSLKANQYFMGCIHRVFQMSGLSPDMISCCLCHMDKALTRVCSDFRSPVSKSYYLLFEAFATLVRTASEKDPRLLRRSEKDPCLNWKAGDKEGSRFVSRACEHEACRASLFDSCIINVYSMIMRRQATELYPYVFQLVAQLVDLNGPPVLPVYMRMFDKIMLLETPDLWEKPAFVPAVVRLLQSFLQQAPNEVNREERLKLVVGKIHKLVSSSRTEEHGFCLLNTLIGNYGYHVIAEYMNDIWASLFTRLQNDKTPRLVRCVIVFMSLFLVKHGVQTLVDLINSVNADLFHVILGEYWIPYLMTITGHREVKLTIVASSKLLCESASLLDPAAEELWGKLLDATVTLLSLPQEERVEDDDEPQILDFTVGYHGSEFIRLQHAAGKKPEDPLKEIEDPKQFFVAFPANLSAEFLGRFPLVVTKYLSPPNQAALVNLCNSYNILIL